MNESWLISYRYHYVYLLEGGVQETSRSHDAVLIIDEHPVAFMLTSDRQEKLVTKRGYTGKRDDDLYLKIERIYSTTLVPEEIVRQQAAND